MLIVACSHTARCCCCFFVFFLKKIAAVQPNGQRGVNTYEVDAQCTMVQCTLHGRDFVICAPLRAWALAGTWWQHVVLHGASFIVCLDPFLWSMHALQYVCEGRRYKIMQLTLTICGDVCRVSGVRPHDTWREGGRK